MVYILEIRKEQGRSIDESIYENGQDSLHLFLLPNLSTCVDFQKE